MNLAAIHGVYYACLLLKLMVRLNFVQISVQCMLYSITACDLSSAVLPVRLIF